MEPAFQRGDILFLDNRDAAITVGGWTAADGADLVRGVMGTTCADGYSSYDLDISGSIVVFKIAGRDIPIVHRVLRKHEFGDGRVDFLTKGDNNPIDDRNLYAPGQLWLSREEILGTAVAYVPYLGMATILMNDYPVSGGGGTHRRGEYSLLSSIAVPESRLFSCVLLCPFPFHRAQALKVALVGGMAYFVLIGKSE